MLVLVITTVPFSCKQHKMEQQQEVKNPLKDSTVIYQPYSPKANDIVISRVQYANKLFGFWLVHCFDNWTGLVTEMDKVGNIGESKTGDFDMRDDWGKADLPNIWSGDKPSDLSETIGFVFRGEDEIWVADDGTTKKNGSEN